MEMLDHSEERHSTAAHGSLKERRGEEGGEKEGTGVKRKYKAIED